MNIYIGLKFNDSEDRENFIEDYSSLMKQTKIQGGGRSSYLTAVFSEKDFRQGVSDGMLEILKNVYAIEKLEIKFK